MEDVNKRRRISFSLSKLECGPQEINSREIRLHLPISNLKPDVFAAVAVVDAEAPYFIRMTCTFLLHRQINAEIRAANSKLD